MSEREEPLIDRLFSGADPAKSEVTAEEASAHAELEELVARVRTARADTSDWSPLREGALVGRVLARTTREDLSWRGELGLLRRFVSERLSDSPLLRLVAASLLVHVFALPVVAWYLTREPEPGPRLVFDIPLETGEEAFLEEEEEPWTPEPSAIEGEVTPADRIENARRRARFRLSTRRGPELPSSADDGLEIRLLHARTRGLETGRWETWLDDVEAASSLEGVERVLWTEVLLDRAVLRGGRSPALGPLLNGLAREVRGAGTDTAGSLERSSLDRARAYGLWETPSGFDPLRIPLPLEAEWLRRLEDALGDLAEHPAFAAFRDWCRP